jgi:hypothetical protein
MLRHHQKGYSPWVVALGAALRDTWPIVCAITLTTAMAVVNW